MRERERERERERCVKVREKERNRAAFCPFVSPLGKNVFSLKK
jgi:hypothetical protein